ncbi:hypothetical protein NB705_003383 [Xanthomonas sacchari]|nr:hypothetical protein [Xanthomonas sacchari]
MPQFAIERVHALDQRTQVLAAGDFQAAQRALHAVLEHLFQAVPGVGGALAGLADPVLHRIAHRIDPAAGQLAGALLQAQAFLHQGLEQLAALGLRTAERADPGQPDLLRRFAQALGQLFRLRLQGVVGSGGAALLAGGLLQSGHDGAVPSAGEWRGSRLGTVTRVITPADAGRARGAMATSAGAARYASGERRVRRLARRLAMTWSTSSSARRRRAVVSVMRRGCTSTPSRKVRLRSLRIS